MTLWLFIITYAVFEGITEGMTWNYRDGARHRPKYYHLYRLFETLAIGGLMVGTFLTCVNVLQIVVLMPISLLIAFLPYRVAFVMRRGQPLSYIASPFNYKIEFFRTIEIEYPSIPILIGAFIGGNALYYWLIW